MKFCVKSFERLLTVTCIVSALIIAWMVILIDYDVVARYLANRPLAWSIDVSGYSLLSFTFISAAWVLKQEGHVSVKIFIDLLNPKWQAVVNIITSLVAALVSIIFMWVAASYGLDAYHSRTMLFTSIMFPKYILLWVMAFGMLITAIQFIRRAWENFDLLRPIG